MSGMYDVWRAMFTRVRQEGSSEGMAFTADHASTGESVQGNLEAVADVWFASGVVRSPASQPTEPPPPQRVAPYKPLVPGRRAIRV